MKNIKVTHTMIQSNKLGNCKYTSTTNTWMHAYIKNLISTNI